MTLYRSFASHQQDARALRYVFEFGAKKGKYNCKITHVKTTFEVAY